jgi:hypothetical protein
MPEPRIDGPALLELVREVVAKGGLLEIRVHGSSMFPTLADGDRVVLGPRRRATGALVLAEIAGQPMLHRVARMTDQGALLVADASRREDWVKLGQICAEVRAVRREHPRWLARLVSLLRRLAPRSDQSSGEIDAGSPSKL